MSYVSVVGLESSIAMLVVGGLRSHRRACRESGDARLVDRVDELGWRPFRPLSDPGSLPHIVSLRHARHRPDVTAARLASEYRIICGGRGDGLRISLHAYNDEADVDRLAEALGRL